VQRKGKEKGVGGGRETGEREVGRDTKERQKGKKDRPKEIIREAREKKTHTVSERNGNVSFCGIIPNDHVPHRHI
jgi:hypothetical protein